tara:strand:+ start:71 stop:430 length:360 start_codon:yes stop_codon:yes gene_type:complete
MSIKLVLLKSGEDIICDVAEMAVGEDEKRRVVGYFLNKPCTIKMLDPRTVDEEQKAGFQVSLFPWMPLTKEETIPVTADWVITIVEPITKLKEMYLEDIVNYGKDDKSSSTDESSVSDK